jgi:hypothetical protein
LASEWSSEDEDEGEGVALVGSVVLGEGVVLGGDDSVPLGEDVVPPGTAGVLAAGADWKR